LRAFAPLLWVAADTGPERSLARTQEGKPGLPRGRSRLPPRAVQASQFTEGLTSQLNGPTLEDDPAVGRPPRPGSRMNVKVNTDRQS